MRLNLFWKLGFAFFALLIAVLLPVDFYAERALRRDYERAGFEQLAAIARIALANPPQSSSLASASYASADRAALRDWVAKEIGPIAKPKEIRFGDNLPKTRSGKIMRRLLRVLAKGEEITQDVSTLENPAILEQLKQAQ